VNIGNLIAVASEHDPMIAEEPVTKLVKIDQGLGQAQFLYSAHHGSVQTVLDHGFSVFGSALTRLTY